MVIYDWFTSTLTLSSIATIHPSPPATWQSAVHVFLDQFHTDCWSQSEHKGPCSLNNRNMCSDQIAASDNTGADKDGQAFLLHLLTLRQYSPSLAKVTSTWLNRLASLPLPLIFLFFPSGARHWVLQYSKQLHIWRKLGSDYKWQVKDSEKTWEDLKFISDVDPWHRESLQ